ncbi:MAG TPA: HRDC domain-containing protein [Acidimicrobiia bacterium]|nr:HRDC domain-containing protein [Acidimicrobiia bacterium]
MLVANTPDLEQLVTDFSGADAYALDTEFHGEGRYYPRLAVIQLAIPGRVAVIDATAVDPRTLQRLVAGPGVAVTHAGGQDLEIMERACGARPSRVFDTQIAAGFLGYGSASLATLVTEFLGRRMDKSPQLSDWFQRPLSAEQIAYAGADVAHLLELRAVLETRLADVGRLEWANEECERLGTSRSPDVTTAWWRLKGSSRLKALARGRAQELAAWRERAARVADRPARNILPDEAIVGLAERPPRSAADIPKSRLFDPRRLSKETVQELIAAAARGADLAPEAIRLPPDSLPSHFQGLAGLIAAWVQQQARDLSIDAALLATRSDIEAFLQNESDPRLRQGWRADVIGATVDRIARGRAAVAYDGAGALILVDR